MSLLEWMQQERGLKPETLAAFDVELDAEGALKLPYPNGYKLRYHDGDTRRFQFIKRDKLAPMGLFGLIDPDNRNLFLTEGESDAMRLWQELEGDSDVLGISGHNGWDNAYLDQLDQYQQVWVILDNDRDYMVQARVDEAWRNIRAAIGKRARRLRLPDDVKDVCEFFDNYDLEALRLLASRQPGPGQSRFRPLDLTKEPPPVRWLVEGMFCRGDIHLMIGEPGIGKSWLTMALAMAISGAHESYLGLPVAEHGRVLYFDEENPEDLVFNRFVKLGMTEEQAKNIRYINNVGVRLDKGADVVVEEAMDFEPVLIVLDSLTRFHTEDENHAGAMAALFHGAVKPLARDTGAAVVLIHHASKTESNSSYRRARGSGDITASVDCGYDVREIGENALAIANFKSRRQAQGDTMYVSLRDTADGRVALIGGAQPEIPF